MNNSIPQHKNYAIHIAVLSFIAIFAYATLRYIIFGTTPWIDMPLYITNKALSFTAIVLISISFSIKPYHCLISNLSEARFSLQKDLGLYGFIIALIHMIFSFIAFNTDVYDKFFDQAGDLTNAGGISLLAGALAFYVLYKLKMSHNPKSKAKIEESKNATLTKKFFILAVLLFVALHLIFMALVSWFNPSIWNGGMPPISLIAFVFVFIAFILNLFSIAK